MRKRLKVTRAAFTKQLWILFGTPFGQRGVSLTNFGLKGFAESPHRDCPSAPWTLAAEKHAQESPQEPVGGTGGVLVAQ